MQFPFNEKKAAQAAAHLLKLKGGTHDYGSVVKLLYLADRAALIEDGLPITGDVMWLMEYGPALETVMDCMNGNVRGTDWRVLMTTRDEANVVRLISPEPPVDELSEWEIGILDAIHAEHGQKTWWQLLEVVHGLPEYQPVPRGSRRPLPPETVLEKANIPAEKIDLIAAKAALLLRAVGIGGSGL